MDSQGRLHMPGFVGQSFEETGVMKKSTIGEPRANAPQEMPLNRKARRAAMKMGELERRR